MSPLPAFDPDSRRVRMLALAVVVLLHLLFYRGLLHGFAAPVVAPPAGALRVEFIERPPAEVHEPQAPGDRSAQGRPEREPRRMQAPSAPPAPDLPPASTPAPDRPLLMDWKQRSDGGSGFPRVLADDGMPDATAAGAPDRFRMRRQLSGKDVIEGAARFLGTWPAGYTTDPCPRIGRNIGSLMTDGRPAGRRALAEELRRQQAACRQ